MTRNTKNQRFLDVLCKPLPPVETIKKVFDYNPATGDLLYAKSRRPADIVPGQSGYCRVSNYLLGPGSFAVHRLAWKLMTGRDPVGVIDHINGERDDNRFSNLRDVSLGENAANNHGRGYWFARRKEKERANRERIRREFENKKAEKARLQLHKCRYIDGVLSLPC